MAKQNYLHRFVISYATYFICCLGVLFSLTVATKASSVYVHGEPKYKCPARPKLIYPCICEKGSDVGLYIRCEKTNLATLSVAFQNLVALGIPVEHLTIYKGEFVRLYGPIFSKVRARLLTIEDTPIEIIEDYAFYGINKTLEQVSILRSNLSSITPLSFGVWSQFEILTYSDGKVNQLIIDGHSMENVKKDMFVGQEISNGLEVIRLINGPLNDIPIETFQPLRKLKTLDLHGNQLENLKKNQFKNLRTVEVFDISFNKIKKLEAQHIADLSKLGWCNVSNNELTELSRGTFARNSVLKVLNLSHNHIARLDANSFRGMRFLRRLYLGDNKISDIGRGTFGSVAKIGTIDLARNALNKIEYQMFSQLNYVEILDLAENNITIIEKNAFKDIYQALINISHNGLHIIEPYAFENCVNITVLDLSFNRIENFSRNSFDVTTFATEFQLSHNLLTSLNQIPLQNMTGLKLLNASHNQIAEIPKKTFPNLYELHTIDVSHNNVSFIANGVFQTLFSLRQLNLGHNSLQVIKPSVFGTLPTLIEMDLSHNNLTSVVRGALIKLTSLRMLNLSNNKLEKLFEIPISLNNLDMSENRIDSIPDETWPVMNSLLFLDLSNNRIGDSLMANSFKGLLVLQRLLLKGNIITQPPLECLARMSTLQYLHLEHNNITALSKSAFGKLPVLFELNLHNNGVLNISKLAFEGLLQLLTLNLSSNSLRTIPNEAFVGLPSLRKLDLSFNRLTKLDNKTYGVLDDLLSLEDLNLSHNKISFVTKKTFPSNQYIPYNLKNLDLSHNQMPVLTYDITFGTKKLLTLNLSSNHINEIRRGVLGNFTALQHLDLNNNELSNLVSEEHVFDLPRNLTRIFLQNNKIYRVPFENFSKEPRFEIIDLRNNSLTQFPETLVWNLQNGTKVLFAGNPLHCSCATRPLKHFTLEQTVLTKDTQNIICQTPIYIQDQYFTNVLDENLQCSTGERELYSGVAYDERPDVRFRDIKVNDKSGNLTARWFVTSVKDVADFDLYVRNPQNEILYEDNFVYNERSAQIPIAILKSQTEKLQSVEICIVSKDSNGRTGHWFDGQCQKLPELKQKKNIFLGNWLSAANPSAGSLNIFSMFLIVFVAYVF